MNKEDNRVYKCTLCIDRVDVGQEPACVKTCPTGAIHFGSKEAMKSIAAERVDELNTRGYQNAGLYDPAGVGGTHVMYVLHHADKPQLYHGLPDKPIDQPGGDLLERRVETAGGYRLCCHFRSQCLPLYRGVAKPR